MRQRIILVLLLAVLIGGAAYLFTRDTSDDNTFTPELDTDAADTTAPSEEPLNGAEQADELLDQLDLFKPPPAGAAITGETPCPEADGTSERTTSFENAPPMCIDPTLSYTAVMSTDFGDITIELDATNAPLTVNNFVVLSRYGYYRDVPFHRIIPTFVIQGGDAVGGGDPEDLTLGAGNPGYAVPDELPEDGAYQVGSLAMANSGPDTNGSQFFIITGARGTALSPDFSLFGQVIDGMDVVEALDAIGTENQGLPTEVVNIRDVTIIEG